MKHAIPVLYYHSIGNHPHNRHWSFLTTPVSVFEAHLAFLTQQNYYFADLAELHQHIQGKKVLPTRSVVLTFDDGFLDNYVIAYPLARRYGARFTVFVNPDFVEPNSVVRSTLDDVWAGKLAKPDLKWWGYLSWKELSLLQNSGVVDIQSHALTHTWYPVSNKIIDFHHPGANYYWLYWNLRPERKPYWLHDYTHELIPFGYPVYENKKALLARIYEPSVNVIESLINYVIVHGGTSFFEQPDWRQQLERVSVNTPENGGRYESEQEQYMRLTNELRGSKEIIEEKLGKAVFFLAWPGGGHNEALIQLAQKVGYWATTKGKQLNYPGSGLPQIMRGAASFSNRFPLWFRMVLFRAQIDRLSGRKTPLAQLFSLARTLMRPYL